MTEVDLRIDTRHETSGELTIYQTPAGSQQYLSLIQTDEVDPASQLRIWKIIYWMDPGEPDFKRSPDVRSWGSIKAAYRP